jgi:tRNA pseudouridine55 synthase
MARRRPPVVHGLMVIDKPAGMTSHDVVGAIRRRLGERRVGHAGTLDPDATGVLLVVVGVATRLVRFLSGQDKDYIGEIVLGTETDTLDAAGSVVATHDMSNVTLDAVRSAIESRFLGEQDQIPPMVSAIKVQGRRLHELAREGTEIDRAPRRVRVDRFVVDATPDPLRYRFEVSCSAGTYVRSLAADLGAALGGGAHLGSLRRTRIGRFTIDMAAGIDEAERLDPVACLAGFDTVTVDAATAATVLHGAILDIFEGSGPWAVLGPEGNLLAVYEAHGDRRAKPSVVLPAGA